MRKSGDKMWVYKITNIQNGKVYIGQTIRPVQDRFHRHITDSLSGKLDTKFARAIRKYGKNLFCYEIIDTAKTQEELTEKEIFWINFFSSVALGYNEVDVTSKCGGNTYKNKNSKELEVIKEKIRKTKLGAKNPNARKVKKINLQTGEEEIFDTLISCAKSCGIRGCKTSIMKILKGKTKVPYKKIFTFEYCDEQSVSTSRDECSGVGTEIDTVSEAEGCF